MKKPLLFTILIFCVLIANAQSRLGFTSKAIIDEFGSKYKIHVDYTSDGDLVVDVNFNNKYMVYYMFLEKSDFCNGVIVEPKSIVALNYMVEEYNKNYVIIGERKWKMYDDNGLIANISLMNRKDSKPIFVWTFSE